MRIAAISLLFLACAPSRSSTPDLAVAPADLWHASPDSANGCGTLPPKPPVPAGNEEQCTPVAKRPAPTTFATTLDLTDIAALTAGTCRYYESPARPNAYQLPSDPSAYPVKIILPIVAAPDCECEHDCNSIVNGPTTAFGIALEQHGVIGGDTGRAFGIRVEAPWYLVSGPGEAHPTPCIGGYQEFQVRSCTQIGWGNFGFSTHETTTKTATAILELVARPDGEVAQHCCPFE